MISLMSVITNIASEDIVYIFPISLWLKKMGLRNHILPAYENESEDLTDDVFSIALSKNRSEMTGIKSLKLMKGMSIVS